MPPPKTGYKGNYTAPYPRQREPSASVMSACGGASSALAPSREVELEAQVAELTQKLERETYRSAQLAAQVKEKTRKHGELV